MDDPTSSAPARPTGRAPVLQTAPVSKAKPDARPMRVALGAAGLAVFSALATAIVLPPRPQAGFGTAGGPTTVQPAVQYVQLQPGQTAPPGARVINPGAPQPVSVVTTVPAPAQAPITIKTTQSGRVIP